MSATFESDAQSPVAFRDDAIEGNHTAAELDEAKDDLGLSDDESVLSEVDEAQFEDFNPDDVAIEDRPLIAADEENLRLIGRHKRKRPEDGEDAEKPRRKKEGRRERKSRRQASSDDAFSGEEGERKRRVRKSRDKEHRRKEAPPDDDEHLDPATSE
jgi:transcription factor SPN1